MRKRKYLSPSQVMKWRQDKSQYYIDYLSDNRVPRDPQTLPMAIGSAFDILVKKSLAKRFDCPEAFPYDVDALAKQNIGIYRIAAVEAGYVLLQAYKDSGAYHDLCSEIGGDLRMEFTEMVDIWGVPFMIKPDIMFTSVGGHPSIYDWKVNGYCSKSNTSPQKGYVKVRDGWTDGPRSRGNMLAHKDADVINFKGVMINTIKAHIKPDWGLQTAIYGKGCGMTEPFLVGIEQLACKTVNSVRLPRVASHRWVCTSKFLEPIKDEVQEMWEIVNSDWIFRDMSRDESLAKCAELDRLTSLGDAYALFK